MDGRSDEQGPGGNRPRGSAPRRTRATTTRWLVGRVVKVSVEAGCGFLRTQAGELVYFALGEVTGQGRLRPGERVRYVLDGAEIPRAGRVTRC
jgi:hypothetical protein